MVDLSITHKHSHYLLSLTKFFGKELISVKFTNAKAFVLACGSMKVTSYMIANNVQFPLNESILPIVWILSSLTLILESYGILLRFGRHYKFFFRGPCKHSSFNCYTLNNNMHIHVF